jgi:hypothetical protein
LGNNRVRGLTLILHPLQTTRPALGADFSKGLNRIMWSAFLAALLLQTPLDLRDQSGFVTLVATSTYGHPVPDPKIEVQALKPDGPVAVAWRNGGRLPYGKYRFRVHATAFHQENVELDLNTIAVTITVGLRFGGIDGGERSHDVVMKVDPVESECRFLTLKPVFYSGSTATLHRRYLISNEGTVGVEGVVLGTYFFAILRKDGSICRAGTVDTHVTSTKPILIDTPRNPPPH